MTLSTLANFAEVFGAFAVIVSLIYLAFQVRANTQEQRHRLRYDQFEIQSSIYDLTIENSESTRIFLKASDDYQSLTDEERIKYGMTFLKAFHAFHLTMQMRDEKAIDEDTFRGFEQFLLGSLDTPGGRYWWNNMLFPKRIHKRVRDHFSKLLDEAEVEERRGRRR